MSTTHDALAIVLARAGSKGLPGKNTALVGGAPCVAWTIRHAARTLGASGVVVSTDCEGVEAVARSLGVRVIARPAALAHDTATVDDAARHAVRTIERDLGQPLRPEQPIAILYGNVPVRPDDLLDRALARLLDTGADSVQSYAPVGKHHPWWTARVDDAHGAVSPWEGERLNNGCHRRQDLPAAYIPDGGCLVVTRRALFLEIPGVAPGPHAFLGSDVRGVVTREGDVVDIDSRVDLLVADALLRERAATEPEPPRAVLFSSGGAGV